MYKLHSICLSFVSAGWQQLHEAHVKKIYFEHLLFSLGNPPLHRVRDVKHFKHPIHHESIRTFSYRIFDLDVVTNALAQQNTVALQISAAFRHGVQVDFQRFASTEEAVEAAKQRAFSRFTTRVQGEKQTPTSRSEIVISLGKGRATREFELIWWPHMFRSCADYGKLTVCFFVSKTTFNVLCLRDKKEPRNVPC